MSKLAAAKALADEWKGQKQDADEEARLCHHFDGCTPDQLIWMWETGCNLNCGKLSQFEFAALVEKWLEVFGDWPPFDEGPDEATGQSEEPSAPEPELPSDDTMLSTKEVVRLMGISKSTLKRMVQGGRFPKYVRISERRIGWPARDVKAWLAAAEEARAKGRY